MSQYQTNVNNFINDLDGGVFVNKVAARQSFSHGIRKII